MQSMQWSLAAAYDVVAAAAPDRDVLVWKDRRRTYLEVATRSRNFAAFLQRRGIGPRRERGALERWECGQSPVALLLYNCPEYIEAMLGCFRARAVPFNVKQHYRPEEIRSLLDMIAFCERIHRHASGKGDYSWARSVAEKATPAARGPTA
jgi:fatty-acyl-CoA synthase